MDRAWLLGGTGGGDGKLSEPRWIDQRAIRFKTLYGRRGADRSRTMSIEARKIRLVMHLRKSGIGDMDVLSAIERIPRERFVPPTFMDKAYEDMALPIGLGQTISQPLVVASMTQALQLKKTHKVLEVGTGSGYQTAILAMLSRRVYTR